MCYKIFVSIFILTFSFPVLAKTKKSDSKISQVKMIKDFKDQFFYELTMSDDEPPTTTNCGKIGDPEIKKFSSYKCDVADETTVMFYDWNCSTNAKSKPSVSIILGNRARCEKALDNFRARF